MDSEYISHVKSLMKSVYIIADDLDAKGIGGMIPFVDSEEGMRGAIRADILLFVLRIIENDKRINDECVAYLNECIGFNFTPLTAEIARKKAVESNIPQLCVLLPPFIEPNHAPCA